MGLSGFAVSPHTGARLETPSQPPVSPQDTLMPPHTGARLETHRHTGKQTPAKMPPTRGHDLKQLVRGPMRVPGGDASTPGNVLKYFAPHLANTPGDAPTVSLLSVLLSSLFSLTLF